MKIKTILVLGFLVIIVYIAALKLKNAPPEPGLSTNNEVETTYNPQIDPQQFTHVIDNKYFSLSKGRELTYQGQTPDGIEKIVISIPGDTKEIMGVTTLLYLDKVWIDGELVEDTIDYLAQDQEGNVWYFGEEVNNYVDGKLSDHAGSWIAGEDGALPGIWIKSKHTVNDTYKQEYYQGKAEDMRTVVSVMETVKIKLGDYTDCVNMYDWTPLDPEAKENKFYCPELGVMVLETKPTGERVELISIK